jgi:hypothetical protein
MESHSPHGGDPNGIYLVPNGESFPHTGGDPKGIHLVPKGESFPTRERPTMGICRKTQATLQATLEKGEEKKEHK